jgi:predicted nucleic-acid-binding Zn-ribbon protein
MKKAPTVIECRNCGYLVSGLEAKYLRVPLAELHCPRCGYQQWEWQPAPKRRKVSR